MNRNWLDFIFGVIAVWLVWKYLIQPKILTLRGKIKDYAKNLQYNLEMNRDIYSTENISLLEAEILSCKEIIKEKDKKVLQEFYESSQKNIKKIFPANKFSFIGEHLDVLLVTLCIAFALRALFFQPFKIPTSSMQPTLHGVNIYDEEQINYLKNELHRPVAGDDSRLRIFLNALYYGQSYADLKAPSNGSLQNFAPVSIREVVNNWPGIPFLQSFSKFEQNDTQIYIPIPYHKIKNEIESNYGIDLRLRKNFRTGDQIFKGVCEDGDALFVNRIIYNLRNPARGDITVFLTDGITEQGEPLSGKFFIKRLVGLPNETIRIKNDQHAYLVIDGKEVPISEEHHPSFKKIYSMNGGYHGHWMSRYGEINGKIMERTPENFQLVNYSTVPNNSPSSIFYLKDTYTFTNGRYVSENSSAYFTRQQDDSYIYTSPLETKVFVKFDNDTWHIKTLVRKDGYEVKYEEDYEEYKLGKNQYFLLGDNSLHSADSRYWGPVPRKNIMGTAMFVFWPFSHRWGIPDKYEPLNKPTVIQGKF